MMHWPKFYYFIGYPYRATNLEAKYPVLLFSAGMQLRGISYMNLIEHQQKSQRNLEQRRLMASPKKAVTNVVLRRA